MPETATESSLPLAASLRFKLGLRDGESLYGIVDAAQDARLAFDAKDKFNVRIRTLFQGKAVENVSDVAPYLVPINLLPMDQGNGYLDRWAESWGKNAGILLTTKVDAGNLLRHLRKIFVVQNETGQEFFFRFYDPRVLRSFLPTCTTQERAEFFGPICSLVVEGETPDVLYRFRMTERGLQRETVNL